MFKKIMSLRNSFIPGSVLALSLFLSSCLKDKDDSPQSPVAAMMAFNLAPDQESVSISLNGNVLPGGSLAYGNFTGQYFNVYPGNRSISSYNTSTGDLVDSSSFTFEPNKYYSLFVVGSGTDHRNIVAEDNYDSLTASSGKSYVRFVNALSNAPSSNVNISANGAIITNGSTPFGTVSEFLAVDPGEIAVNVTNEGTVNASRNISVAQSKAYTVLLMGLPNQADSTKSVQIRFIENGSITD
jgi:hypothetical protein